MVIFHSWVRNHHQQKMHFLGGLPEIDHERWNYQHFLEVNHWIEVSMDLKWSKWSKWAIYTIVSIAMTQIAMFVYLRVVLLLIPIVLFGVPFFRSTSWWKFFVFRGTNCKKWLFFFGIYGIWVQNVQTFFLLTTQWNGYIDGYWFARLGCNMM